MKGRWWNRSNPKGQGSSPSEATAYLAVRECDIIRGGVSPLRLDMILRIARAAESMAYSSYPPFYSYSQNLHYIRLGNGPNKTSSPIPAPPPLFALTHSASTRKKIQTHLLTTSASSITNILPSRSFQWSKCGLSFRLHVHRSTRSIPMAV